MYEESALQKHPDAAKLMVFSNEEEKTTTLRNNFGAIKRKLPHSYTDCFKVIFWMFAFIGCLGIIVSLNEFVQLASLVDALPCRSQSPEGNQDLR